MRLATIVDEIAMECDLEKSTIGQYRLAAKRFSEFIGKDAVADDLTRETLNKFIQNLQSTLTNTTSSNYRRAMCRIWNFLTQNYDKPAYEIQRLRRPKAEQRPVHAWTMAELSALINTADEIPGILKIGIKASDYLKAWLWTAFDTGLRPSDMFELRWDQINLEERKIPLTQHKTSKPHCTFLSDESVVCLKAIREPLRDLVFPLRWGGVRRYADKLFREAKSAGFVKRSGENLGTIRKTHATEMFLEHDAAAAAESLGHVSGSRIAKLHYIDSRAVRKYSIPRRPNAQRPAAD